MGALGRVTACATTTGKCGAGAAENVKEVVEGFRAELWWGICAPPMPRPAGIKEKSTPVHSLPDDVMMLIFAHLPRRSLAAARKVCASWKRVAEQQDLAALRRQMGVAEGWIYVLAEAPEESPFGAYDPDANKWSVLPATPGRTGGQQWQGFACVALGHKLLLIGGTRTDKSPASDTYSSGVVCGDVAVYDALTNKWSRGASMGTPRSWFAAAAVGAKVYVAGGQGNTKFLDSAEVYDSEADTWTPVASMGTRRSSCHGAALGGRFWVIAGEYEKSQYGNNQRSSAEVYDAETDTWQFIPNMCLDDNKVLGPSAVVDGALVCVHQRKIMAYDAQRNAWSHLGHVNGGEEYARSYSRFGFACAGVGSGLYVVGGARYVVGGAREYSQNRHRYCTLLNTIEVCDLDAARKTTTPQLWWKLGADMGHSRGTVSASAVLWL